MALRPRLLTWEDCAPIPYPFLTAYQALFDTGLLQAGQHYADFYPKRLSQQTPNGGKRLLITDAAGPVGFWAIQLARLTGCGWITGLVSHERDKARVCLLGAHEALNKALSEGNMHEWAHKKFDVILDCEGFDTLKGCWKAIAKDGHISSTAEHPKDFMPDEASQDIKATWVQARPCANQLALATHLLNCGILKHRVQGASSIFEWEEHGKALHTAYSLSPASVTLRVRNENPQNLIQLFAKHDDRGVEDGSTQAITHNWNTWANVRRPGVNFQHPQGIKANASRLHKQGFTAAKGVAEGSPAQSAIDPKDEVDAFKKALETFRDAQRAYMQAAKVLREAAKPLREKTPQPMPSPPNSEAGSSSSDIGTLPDAGKSNSDPSLDPKCNDSFNLEAIISDLPDPSQQAVFGDYLNSLAQIANSESERFLSPEFSAHLDAMIGNTKSEDIVGGHEGGQGGI
ncbi:hypothetical protein B0H67DRAFT_552120 [Lasiosphaeris hirsuta]|uniref:Alcohol dehydrogenase-like C-terminal domain-containing protein n=1 Tax=Lasiosphaeris hirsuta TaxID=260670 RepID=A0AA40APW9_9PEZI|nr:hypothetical protein B0H67DRAFT_552120 [Lasiosphaeris hirsuta]